MRCRKDSAFTSILGKKGDFFFVFASIHPTTYPEQGHIRFHPRDCRKGRAWLPKKAPPKAHASEMPLLRTPSTWAYSGTPAEKAGR
jgi:hypothetical protein